MYKLPQQTTLKQQQQQWQMVEIKNKKREKAVNGPDFQSKYMWQYKVEARNYWRKRNKRRIK